MPGFEDILQEKVSRHGKQIITNLSILLKMTSIYESMNEAIMNTSKKIVSEINPVLEIESEVSIKISDGSFFIEDIRIKSNLSDIDNFEFLATQFSKRGIGVITLKAPLHSDSLVNFAYAIKEGNEASDVQSALDSRLTSGISVDGPVSLKREDDLDMSDTRRIASRAYARALSVITDINNTVKTGKSIQIKKAKRSIQSIVDCLLKDETYLLNFIAQKNFENYTINHSVNVAILSIIMGKRLGLSKYQLSKLGIIGLFHDIGKAEIPLSLLNKSAEFEKKEWGLIKRHPIDGVKILVKLSSLSEFSISSMMASFEHHIHYDLNGYPKLPSKRKPCIFSRIVFIADQYDALTSGRVYGRTPYGAEKVLKFMHQKINEHFDPLLVKVFTGAGS